jgi:hypothetical protein
MFGKDDRETMDKMATALNGYRQRDATANCPRRSTPTTRFEVDKAPEAIRAYLPRSRQERSGLCRRRRSGDGTGVPVKTMHAITTAAYAGLQEAGMLEPMVNIETERAALLPDAAKNLPKAEQDKAIDARMLANEQFIKLLTKPVDAAGQPIPGGKTQLTRARGAFAMLARVLTKGATRRRRAILHRTLTEPALSAPRLLERNQAIKRGFPCLTFPRGTKRSSRTR